MLSVRPKVAQLVFQLSARSVHPELYVVHKSLDIERGGYRARVEITNSGHLITWRYRGLTLTEVCTVASDPLPRKRQLFRHHLNGSRTDCVQCLYGVTYETSFHLEPVEPHIFQDYLNQLQLDGPCQGLLHTFDSSGRIAQGALSYIYTESRSRTLHIQALHTFPDDCVIVKSESVFTLPQA